MTTARSRPRRVAAALVVAAIGISVVAAGAGPATATRAGRDLPPPRRAQLARIFDPLLAPLGLRTTRALLQDPKRYRPSPTGTHLAVYVEPTSATYTDEQYVDGVLTVANVFVPRVFKRWMGLESFDVCQEPLPAVDDGPSPPPMTQVVVNRPALRRVDWTHATLTDLLLATPTREERRAGTNLFVYAAPDLRDEPAWATALAAYRAARDASTTTTAAPAA